MARYEFSQGSSQKFWEITVKGKSFTTTYGKIGTNGQSKSKSFDSPAEAKKAAEKLTAQKVKKGYVAKKGGAKAAPKKTSKAAPKKASKTAPKKASKAAPKKASKAAPKKASKAAPKKASKAAKETSPATPGSRYFEFTDGGSSKFWEVLVEGQMLTTRHGKIGTDGRKTTKKLASKAATNKERDKLVAQKVKKGYVERGTLGGAPVAGVLDARNKKLEAAINKDPDDVEAFAVLADWLLEKGDPRGDLITLQLSGKEKKAQSFIKKNAAYFLGSIEEHQQVYDMGYNNASSSLRTSAEEKKWQKTQRQAFLWRNGYIHRLRLSHDNYSDTGFDGKLVDVLEEVLAHPSARFVVELAFQSNGDPNDDSLQPLTDLLGKKAPPSVRKITLGDNVDQISWHRTGNLAKMWKGVPNLRVLEVETGHFDVGKMDAPSLERAIFITGGLTKSCGRNIAKAKMPKIKHLEIYYGDENYGAGCTIKDVTPLLTRTDLKHLEVLGLKNSKFADDIAKALTKPQPLLKRLKTLDLSLGAMTDKGAEALAGAKKSLGHLEVLNLQGNFLTKDGIKAVKGLCKKVLVDGQNEPWDWDGEPHYYVSVAE